MKGRVILIAPEGAALVDRGRVEDLILAAPEGAGPGPGDIHRVRVDRQVPKVAAAFVRLAGGQSGYLRDAAGLRPGAAALAQVTAHAEPGKAVPLDRRIVLKGPRLILTPGVPGVNVSRQIRDGAERARLAAAAGGADPARDPGIVLRSAAEGIEAAALAAELAGLQAELARIEAAPGSEPVELRRLDPAGIALAEWIAPPPQEVQIARAVLERRGLAAWERAAAPVLTVAGDPDLFGAFGVWDEIGRLHSPRVELPSGGWMAVEPTRAMVTVDVNTAGEFSAGAALTANLEAAKELPRQLRLRGLGGQVTVDFAPLPKKDRKRIEDALKTSLRRDPVETALAGWTPLGNLELQRKRERRPLAEMVP